MLTILSRFVSAVGVTAILLALALAPSQSLASTIVDTGPGNGVYGYTLGPQQGQAARFEVVQTISISSIELYMLTTDAFAVPGSHYKVELRTFTGGPNYISAGVPGVTQETSMGEVLYTGEFEGDLTGEYSWQGLLGVDWVVNPGSYWVTFTSDGSTGGVRNHAPAPLKDYAFSREGNWYDGDFAAFGIRIQGQPPVIQPPRIPDNFSTVGLFGPLCVGLLLLKRRSSLTPL